VNEDESSVRAWNEKGDEKQSVCCLEHRAMWYCPMTSTLSKGSVLSGTLCAEVLPASSTHRVNAQCDAWNTACCGASQWLVAVWRFSAVCNAHRAMWCFPVSAALSEADLMPADVFWRHWR